MMSESSQSFYNHVAQTSDDPMGLEIDRAEGPYIYTTDGRKFTDLISGIAVSSLGHRHPSVIKAIEKQLEKHLHVMVYGEFIQNPQSKFAQLLCNQLPKKLDRVYFVNSGTESVEGALKLAKKFTGRSKFVAFHNSYHGDTHGSLSVTGRDVYRDPYQPLLPNVHFSEFNSDTVFDLIDEETAAVIMEPIQGEGGIIPAEKEWLQTVRQRCNETGSLLIFDEIQTGFFRTGSLFAFEFYNVVPDIICLAKAMAGGMPMGAFVSSSEIFEVFKKDPPLNHVTTFGGHPVSCAAAHASLQTLLSDDFGAKATEIENIARNILKGEGIVEVRGRGAMLGLQLRDAELTQKVVKHCFEQGLILGWTLHSNSLIRIAPPLIIERILLEESLQVIRESVLNNL
ncbi:MAG: aspartate aminotransferase family protein [Balneolaceae bacterium]|nr:aspartate aminotransferase family protein [Balneolaceae bacterium]